MITKDNILNKVSQEQIMDFYFPSPVMIDVKYHNPFRNDSKKGCYFRYSRAGNLIFFDNSSPENGGDCFKIVMMKYNLNFYEALSKINDDFNLGLGNKKSGYGSLQLTPLRENKSKKKVSKIMATLKKTHYKVFNRKWNDIDVQYWTIKYGIPLKLLEKYNIFPVERFQQRNWDCSYFETKYQYENDLNDPCYCFIFKTAANTSVKIYRPLNSKFKWCGNVSNDNIQGYDQLPETGDILIIASSMKDLLTLVSIGYNAIALQGETMQMPKSIMNKLKKRFKRIIFIYDNDETGLKFSIKEAENNSCEYKQLPDFPNRKSSEKDFADYREVLGQETFVSMCQELIN